MKRKARKARTAARIKKVKQPKFKYTCFRCEKGFPTRKGLKIHSRAHLQALRELTMLEQGQVPVETKMGGEFKGRNKVIVAES